MAVVYIGKFERAVVDRAVEWYEAKKLAEQNAGQPVNWEDVNLAELEDAVKMLLEERTHIAFVWGRHKA